MPQKMSGLIWIQTIWHHDGIPERTFEKVHYEQKKSADDKKKRKISQGAKRKQPTSHSVEVSQ